MGLKCFEILDITLSPNDIENHVERDAVRFFSGIGYEIKRVPKTQTRTVDYEHENRWKCFILGIKTCKKKDDGLSQKIPSEKN
jgi:hypothetical protein